MDILEEIGRLVPGKRFADLGGLWGTVNERVTPAVQAGCASATMIDEQPMDNALWQAFDAHCAARGVNLYARIQGNLDDPGLPARLGRFDVLHCSGVIYHCPDPYHSLRQLRKLTGRHLLLGSMTVPERVENAVGTLDFTEGRMLAMPAMKGHSLAVMRQHFDDRYVKVHNVNADQVFPYTLPDGSANYAPWWWLFTADTLAAMAEAVGLRVVRVWESWAGFAHYLHCEVPEAADGA